MTILKFLSPILFLLLLSCGSGVDVSSDYDRTNDFAQYKTFAFTQKAYDLKIADKTRDLIISSIDSELKAKGLEKGEAPDLIIHVFITSNDEENPDDQGLARWGSGYSPNPDYEDEYDKGTVFINVIDVSDNELVWQGNFAGVLKSGGDTEKLVSQSLNSLFNNFPK